MKLFTSILLGLFGPAGYSSPNGLVRPLVLLLHHWWALVSHLFSLGCLGPIYFPWASPALFLTLHSNGLLLNSLGFLGPITLSLILRTHGLVINPLLSLLSLLWPCRGPFSLFHIIYCPWFAFSLFSSSFKPIYPLKAHLFISWACDLLFLPPELNGFSIYLPNSFLSVLLSFFFPLGLPKWPSTYINIMSCELVTDRMKNLGKLSNLNGFRCINNKFIPNDARKSTVSYTINICS